MKRIKSAALIAMLALLTLMLTACGKSEFGMSENTEKRMLISAENADRNAFFMVGSLEIADGEQIMITSDLVKGAIRVEIVGTPEEQSIDKLPDLDGEAIITADVSRTDSASGTVPAGTYLLKATCLEKATGTVLVEVKPADRLVKENSAADYGLIKGDFSGITPEIAKAYLAVLDDCSAHLGYDEATGAEGEYLHGGFIRDLDSDGIPEMCLLLKTSPRESGAWDGIPIYGWYPPALYLYTYQNGQADLAWNCDLYFATGGREAAIAALTSEACLQFIWFDYSAITEESSVGCYELTNGTLQKHEAPADVTAALQGAKTVSAFLNTLGTGRAQLLLYNNSGEAEIEGPANAQGLRTALAENAA